MQKRAQYNFAAVESEEGESVEVKAEAEVKNLEVLEAEMEVVCVEAYCCSCSFSSQSFIKQI